ncbi:nucleotidyltransferase family protein [Micromonospora sp. NBC_01813]|uniref:nucleotidyltransferase family protein n=1 Tax=Micromonospora sp. NBC_01813 TaxID=2975988 RepID=UPI002DDA337E|nr:NTP transferase domain-containing protein [Micromonospora sp. NBC_01813]WSA10313.1 NTP transferase domain-containing protein [Micromonospora sp. NBC_01813]
MLAGIVLAAGAGRRYGRPKALVRLGGTLLVERAAATLTAAGCRPVVVVVGAGADQVRAAADLADATLVDNPDWASGMASSLRTGLAAVAAGLVGSEAAAAARPPDAVVVLLVDMPGIGPAAVRRVAAGADRRTLAVGGFAPARTGHPVVLGRDHWSAVAATATGDAGARDYLRAHADQVRIVPCGDVADPTDLDRPADAIGCRLPQAQAGEPPAVAR